MQLNVTKWLTLVALLGSAVGALQADSFTRTYTGSLSSSSTVIEEAFSLSSTSNLVVTTTSYGGGTNLDGTAASMGGFQPSITLYTASGNYVGTEQASSPVTNTDSVTGLALDAYLSSSNLSAGGYIITLTNWELQQPPTATNLSDGFTNYGGTALIDAGLNTRNASYALNAFVTPSAAAVPEPTTIELMLVAIGGAALFSRRYSQSRS